MTYVKTRKTGSGAISTALVEAYRNKDGRPRQRVLANLHGEPDALRALAKLASRRDALRKEQEAMAADAVVANQFYEVLTLKTLQGHQYSTAKRKQIDGLMRDRDRLLKRMAKVEAELAAIQKDGVVIKKHCNATPDEVQKAIRDYRGRSPHFGNEGCLGATTQRRAKAQLRRLSS
jgi:hypothetical protein